MRKWLTQNLGLKFLSLLVAVLLWAVFIREPQLMTTVWVPVLLRGIPENLEVSAGLIDRVQLEVVGAGSQLTPERLSEAAVILDLGNVDRPGERTYTIRASDVRLPTGVHFSRAVPSQIRLQFERRVTREVPVRIRYHAGPPHGYSLSREEVIPPRLAIVGPESNVRHVTFVETDAIDLSNVVGPAEFQVNVFVPDPHVRFELEPRVTVRVVVSRQSTSP